MESAGSVKLDPCDEKARYVMPVIIIMAKMARAFLSSAFKSKRIGNAYLTRSWQK